MDTKRVAVFTAMLFASINLLAYDAEAWNAGKSFGSSAGGHYRSNMKSELIEPMTSDKDFKTMDGSKKFRANMTCGESGRSFMTVSYEISSPKGGARPIVQLDKGLAGSKNYTFRSPHVASAVCTNGIGVCSGGIFEGGRCQYYKWDVSANHDISLMPASPDSVSGCVCVNDTCGSMASNNKDAVSNRIASGVYAAISQSNTAYIISKTESTDGIVDYFGQRADACGNHQGSVPNINVRSGGIDASAEQARQAQDDKSAYSALSGASSNFATNSPSTREQVRSSVSASTNLKNSLQHENGTTDFLVNDGKGNAISGHVGIPLDYEREKYCQVKWLGKSETVFTDDTIRSSTTSSGEQWQSETRLCVNDICPYQPSKGEQIKHDCGKINNFAEATSVMSAVSEAAEDMICADH